MVIFIFIICTSICIETNQFCVKGHVTRSMNGFLLVDNTNNDVILVIYTMQ